MTLAIRSDRSLEELESWILDESDFGTIRNHKLKANYFEKAGLPLKESL
jgi:hypothetical protein